MKKGFYAGSFDPFTNGHLHVVTESAELFEEVVVGIGINKSKKRRFSREKMQIAMQQVMEREGLKNVKVITFDGIATDAAIEHGCNILIRGVRNGMDYAKEENMAETNETVSGLNTIYIRAGKLGIISSSLVMELRDFNKDISSYVPKEIDKLIKKKKA